MAQQREHHGQSEADQPQAADEGDEVVAEKSHLLKLQPLEEAVELHLLLLAEKELQRMIVMLLQGMVEPEVSLAKFRHLFIERLVMTFEHVAPEEVTRQVVEDEARP